MTTPTYRSLGRSSLQVSPITLGGNVFGWTADEKTSFSLLDAWLDAGFNFIDTADVYSRWVPGHSGGESETVIGKWLKQSGKRDRVVIATKVGLDMGGTNKGLAPAYIQRAVEDSLRRLQTDRIDLYQSHTDDAETPIADTLQAYAKLIEQGKVRFIGASNFSAARLSEAIAISERDGLPRYQSLQPLYNLYDRKVFEDELEAVCLKHGIGVINFYALAAGFLTGKYRSAADIEGRARAYRLKDYANERGFRIVAELEKVAQRLNAKPAEVAIAWQIARPAITAPIASATSLEQMKDLVAAAHLKLDAEAIESLNRASA